MAGRMGRPPGARNKATAEIKDLVRAHAPDAVKELARLAKSAKSEQARVAAIKELLDRGYGRATQPISGDDSMAPLTIKRIERIIVDPADTDAAGVPAASEAEQI